MDNTLPINDVSFTEGLTIPFTYWVNSPVIYQVIMMIVFWLFIGSPIYNWFTKSSSKKKGV